MGGWGLQFYQNCFPLSETWSTLKERICTLRSRINPYAGGPLCVQGSIQEFTKGIFLVKISEIYPFTFTFHPCRYHRKQCRSRWDGSSLIGIYTVCHFSIDFWLNPYLQQTTRKPIKWHLRPEKTQISLGIRQVWSVFAVRLKKALVLSYPLNAQQTDQTGWMSRLIWDFAMAHMPFCWFCHALAHMWRTLVMWTLVALLKPTKRHVRPAKTQISLAIRQVWSDSSLSAWGKLGSLTTHWTHSEDSDQTGHPPSLIWVFAWRTCHFAGFVTRLLICDVLLLCELW